MSACRTLSRMSWHLHMITILLKNATWCCRGEKGYCSCGKEGYQGLGKLDESGPLLAVPV